MDPTLQTLVSLLDLEAIEVNLFRGRSMHTGGRGVFGGQVIGQALVAAERTVEARAPHSLHGYFLLPGDGNAPIVYQVERIRDGKSFSTRRVQAVQHGRPIFSMIASFQADELGFEHAAPMPDVPLPEALPSTSALWARWRAEAGAVAPHVEEAVRRFGAIEFRPVDPDNPLRPSTREPRQAVWFRAVDRLGDDPALHRCLLAYASDFTLLGTAVRPHGRSGYQHDTFMASIDHALWLHRAARVDEWLLYVMDSPSAQGGRGVARGLVYDRSGRLVASVAQEGVIRDLSRTKPPSGEP
jgi:acyl-CoA thioesterase II